MTTVYSKPLDTTIETDRIIGAVKGKEPGPTVIFLGGIHGNESSGVFALYEVIKTLASKKDKIHGTVYALAGNLPALEKGIRYQKEDLNRIWNETRIEETLSTRASQKNAETTELFELHEYVGAILDRESPPFYFIDLHTTSSHTEPFITVNDNLLNRKFTLQYPVPLLLGIEEYLDGTFLSYINAMGYVAFGFESGQHDALSAIDNHIAFVYLSLVFGGSLPKSEINFDTYFETLGSSTKHLAACYEIVRHYKIRHGELFTMLPGFKNFEPIRKGRPVATSDNKTVKASRSGKIFMPLYQKQGIDGFFIINRVPTFFLTLSTILRKLHIDYLLPFLPGISWASKKRDVMTVDLRIARFFAKKFFHLLGYRSRQIGATKMTIRNREANSRKEAYKKTSWY